VRNVHARGDLVAGQIVIDEEAAAFVEDEVFHLRHVSARL
jgi:hypothetical protein